MKVDILAHTRLIPSALLAAYDYRVSGARWNEDVPTDADALGEAAGRICYRSFDRPNPATAANADYLANIVAQGHFSVLEHASVTFLVRDVSRALLTELTRHRHLSFSVVSQRYVDYSQSEPVIPPALGKTEAAYLRGAYAGSVHIYETLVKRLMDQGLGRKAAREAARAALPNAAPVDMVVTGNLRAWRDVLGKRHSVHADAEIQQFAKLVLGHLRSVATNSVQDVPEAPYGSEGA